MRVVAWCVREPDELPLVLSPGDWIGRSSHAAIRIDDGRISEAHAMVSLRGGTLWLLALRGRISSRGRARNEIALEPGTVIELAEGVGLRCEDVELPDEVFGISFGGTQPQALMGTTSLRGGSDAGVRSGFDADADAVLWSSGETWTIALRGMPPTLFAIGDRHVLSGTELVAVAVPCARAGQTRTRQTLRGAIVWEVSGGIVTIRQPNGAAEELSGVPGRILSVLLVNGPVVDWRRVSEQIWPGDQSNVAAIRNRLDVGLAKLRERLRAMGAVDVRIAMDGNGNLQVSIPCEDTVLIAAVA